MDHPGGDAGGAPDKGHHAGQAVQLHPHPAPVYLTKTVNSLLNHSDLLLDDKKLTAQKANGLCNIQIDSMINGSDFPDRGQVTVNISSVKKQNYK